MYLYQLDTPTCMMAQALLQFLRIWLSLVGFIAVFSGLQAVFGFSVLENRVYTVERACCWDDLTGRLFGMWTILAGALRIFSAKYIYNLQLFLLTIFSFILAFVHFALEVLVFETAALTFGVVMPLIISGISAKWALLMLPSIIKGKEKLT
eukprot:m.192171 g.192171  ORF g.192171 m.192171 type:complete len:151 (+) comp39465_c0_seq24:63-515(+)